MKQARKTARKRGMMYSQGELNKLVDAAVHPLTRHNPIFWAVDGLAHAAIERDPLTTILKFLAYDSPKLLDYSKLSNPRKRKRSQAQ